MRKPHNIDYSQKILEVKNLKQYFRVGMGKRRIVVKAVDGINFDIYKREVFGLVGESGCGKTTTGRTIIKLYNPTDGEVIYNGKTIGMGYEGYKVEARHVRRTAAKEVLYNRPFKRKKRELREQYKYDIVGINHEIAQEKAQTKAAIDKLYEPLSNYKTALTDLKEEYQLDRADLTYDLNTEKSNILAEGIVPVLADRRHYLRACRDRFKDKASFIASLKIEKLEKDEQIKALRTQYNEEIEGIERDISEKLVQFNIDIDSHEVKKEINIVRKAEIAQKKVDIKEVEEKYALKLKELENEYKENHQKLLENTVDVETLKEQKQTLIEKSNEKLNAFKEAKALRKEQYLEKLNELKADYKENPENYVVNQDEIERIKSEKREKIRELRAKIRVAKFKNKLKEFPEDTEIRLAKLKEAEDKYKVDLKELNSECQQSVEKASEKEKSKVKLSFDQKRLELKKKYEQEIEEIQKTKPSFTNYVSTMQMIFQDPISSLNPRMVVSDIISEGLRIKGERNKTVIRNKVYEVLSLVGLDRGHATRYPHEFSGGQRQRIGVARAIIVNPDFIIADEPISALDVSIQAQVINLLNDLKERFGLTMLFIAHDLSVVKYFSDRIAVMYMGKIVELASSEELFENPLHPYTKSLLSAIPYPDPESERKRERILYNPMMHDYHEDKPVMREIKEGHFIYANDKEYKAYQQELKKGGK